MDSNKRKRTDESTEPPKKRMKINDNESKLEIDQSEEKKEDVGALSVLNFLKKGTQKAKVPSEKKSKKEEVGALSVLNFLKKGTQKAKVPSEKSNKKKTKVPSDKWKSGKVPSKDLDEDQKVPSKESEDDDDKTSQIMRKKKKFAIIFGYVGTTFSGLQIQQAMKNSVEQKLWDALIHVGLVKDTEIPNGNMWQRTSRTDKGVHAMINVVTVRLRMGTDQIPEYLKKINEYLPETIHVHKIQRTTNAFHCKKACSHREYLYFMPSFCFAPRDYKNEASKPMSTEETKGFRLSQERRDHINRIMKRFEGTHSYHNFCKTIEDPKSLAMKRFITKYALGNTIMMGDVEYVEVHIHGQSFLYNQIRKMIGFVISECVQCVQESDLEAFFDNNVIKFIPRCPGTGLMLNYVHFKNYNDRYAELHGEFAKGDDLDEMREKFRPILYAHIADYERKFGEWKKFLYMIPYIFANGSDDNIGKGKRIEHLEINETRHINIDLEKGWEVIKNILEWPKYIEMLEWAKLLEGESLTEGSVLSIRFQTRGRRYRISKLDNNTKLLKLIRLLSSGKSETRDGAESTISCEACEKGFNLSWQEKYEDISEVFAVTETQRVCSILDDLKKGLES